MASRPARVDVGQPDPFCRGQINEIRLSRSAVQQAAVAGPVDWGCTGVGLARLAGYEQ